MSRIGESHVPSEPVASRASSQGGHFHARQSGGLAATALLMVAGVPLRLSLVTDEADASNGARN